MSASSDCEDEDVDHVFVSVDNVAKLPYRRLLLVLVMEDIVLLFDRFCSDIFVLASSCSSIDWKALMSALSLELYCNYLLY